MKKLSYLGLVLTTICLMIAVTVSAQFDEHAKPLVDEDVVFLETGGLVAVEAEYFHKQSQTDIRQWYLYSKDVWPKAGRDDDDPHCMGAGNNAYMEILPDTRASHGDKLIGGENFSNEPGKLAVLHYRVHFETPGRYYVWVRAYSTGSEDNGLHVGLNGEWPESGQRLQWCEGKHSWHWESKQRTEQQHCGEPHKIYLDIEEAGEHEIMFSMREDGFEFDRFLLTTDREFERPDGVGPEVKVLKGELPPAFPVVIEDLARKRSTADAILAFVPGSRVIRATSFPIEGSNYYRDGDFLAINPAAHTEATVSTSFNWNGGNFDVVLLGVGENDGASGYMLTIGDTEVGTYTGKISQNTTQEGSAYCKVWENVSIEKDAKISISSRIGSENGVDHTRGRWAGIAFVAPGSGQAVLDAIDRNLRLADEAEKELVNIRPYLTGELKRWHKVTLTFDGPATSETDEFNPFMNYRFNVEFTHEASGKKYLVPGYYAADGNAGNTSAESGNKWRVHFAPDETGKWNYKVDFRKGKWAAVSDKPKTGETGGYMDQSWGSFEISETDKTGRDFRGKGRLDYVGERYLKFAGTGEYFLKVGSDAPENMLAYEEFDGTFHNDGHKDDLVKTWEAHEKHWKEGDPTWKDGKGKDIIGAVNYLASKGMNAFSFLTNNVGGDDQNVFPYVDYNTFDRMDCSKLDQWEVVFEHGDKLGMFMHFKTLEHENQGLLDNGGIGVNTKLYYRELIARYGHHMAMNWNICEESGDWGNLKTPPQFTWQRLSAAAYFAEHDPYIHHIVIHNGAWFDDLYGHHSYYTGASLQTNRPDFSNVHAQTLRILKESREAGKQWAVACDEPGDAQHSLLPDAEDPEHNNARMNGLWGTFMAGGWGTEWYFGYAHAHSDLTCQDYASRDLFWDQGKIALDFFADNRIPFWEMDSHDEWVLTEKDYCLAKPGEIYVFFLKKGTSKVDLSSAEGNLSVMWFNPRVGGELQKGKVKKVSAGAEVDLGSPPAEDGRDWVVLVRKL